MLVLLLGAVGLLAALAVERVRLDRSRCAVPLRIAVTGTRGKTGVCRMLASVLRESGMRVLAKTTGSEPCLILPDGTVERIPRRGLASILEQKALLRRAARLGVDAVVVEVMSIHAENHAVERRIVQPHQVLVTNFRVDHTEAVAATRQSVAELLALDVPEGSSAFVPEAEMERAFRTRVEAGGGYVVEVPGGAGADFLADGSPHSALAFRENVDLVVAAARSLGVEDAAVRRGLQRAHHDLGEVRIWRVGGEGGAPVRLVSGFAANDPESTFRLRDNVLRLFADPAGGPLPSVGLLALRADRGDRTELWADALAGGALDHFDALVVTGLHAHALRRRVGRVRARAGRPPGPPIRVVPEGSPVSLTGAALAALGIEGGVVLGMGNIGGVGEALIQHWSRIGEAADGR